MAMLPVPADNNPGLEDSMNNRILGDMKKQGESSNVYGHCLVFSGYI